MDTETTVLDLKNVSLSEVLLSQDSALTRALERLDRRRQDKATEDDPEVAGFNNFLG